MMDSNPFAVIEQKYSSFSKTFKAIADYVTANYKMISFLTVHKLSKEIGVSTASVVRFCQEIGYSGYNELQQGAQAHVYAETPPMLEFRSALAGMEDDPLKEIFDLNIESIQKTYTATLANEFKKAVDALHGAKKVYVIGMRSTYTVAYYLDFMLSQFMDNTVLVTAGTSDVFDRLSSVKPGDVAIVIGFSRYTQLTVDAAEFLRKKDIFIIGMTDVQSSPIATRSNIALLTKISSRNYSFVSVLTVADALAVALGKKNKEQTMQRLKQKEITNSHNGIYYHTTE